MQQSPAAHVGKIHLQRSTAKPVSTGVPAMSKQGRRLPTPLPGRKVSTQLPQNPEPGLKLGQTVVTVVTLATLGYRMYEWWVARKEYWKEIEEAKELQKNSKPKQDEHDKIYMDSFGSDEDIESEKQFKFNYEPEQLLTYEDCNKFSKELFGFEVFRYRLTKERELSNAIESKLAEMEMTEEEEKEFDDLKKVANTLFGKQEYRSAINQYKKLMDTYGEFNHKCLCNVVLSYFYWAEVEEPNAGKHRDFRSRLKEVFFLLEALEHDMLLIRHHAWFSKGYRFGNFVLQRLLPLLVSLLEKKDHVLSKCFDVWKDWEGSFDLNMTYQDLRSRLDLLISNDSIAKLSIINHYCAVFEGKLHPTRCYEIAKKNESQQHFQRKYINRTFTRNLIKTWDNAGMIEVEELPDEVGGVGLD